MKYVSKESGELYTLSGAVAGNLTLTAVDSGDRVTVPASLLASRYDEFAAAVQERVPKDPYAAQKRYLAKRKAVKVSLPADVHERLTAKAKEEGKSIYKLVGEWVARYLDEEQEREQYECLDK